MIWFLIAQIVTVILDVLSLRLSTDPDKALELLVLRQQIRILERRVGTKVRPSRAEKLVLALSALQLKGVWLKNPICPVVKPFTLVYAT